jgi:type IV pilus assembly protein PilQ
MRSRLGVLLFAVAAGALLPAHGVRASEVNLIQGVDVAEQDGAVELTIRGSKPPSYSVFKLQDPQRLVVDLSGADVTGVASRDVKRGGVLSYSTAQYSDERARVGRVIVNLDGPQRYEVVPRGDAVVVRVLQHADPVSPTRPDPSPAAAGATPPATAGAEAPAATAPEAPPVEPAATAAAEPVPAPPSAASEDHVVSRRIDEKRLAGRPARALTGVRSQAGGVLLATDGQVSRIDILELRDPPRLALDLYGVNKAPRGTVSLDGAFASARFGREAGKVRVVLDAAEGLPPCEVKRAREGVVVVTRTPAAPAVAQDVRQPEPKQAPAQPAEKEAVAAAPAAARIQAIRFTGTAGASRIEIAGKAPFTVDRPDPRTMVLTLDGAELVRSQQRSLDTSAFKGPVQMVSSFNQAQARRVRVVVSLRGPAEDRVAETSGGLVWTISEGTQAAAAEEPAVKVEARKAEAAGFASEAPGYAASGAPQARGFTGRRITLDFHDIDIRNLLRLIADVSKKNIVVADDVTGKITVSLRNVPWDQALELVLAAKGLGREETGNVIRIAKLDTLAKEKQLQADAEKAKIPLIPLKVRIIPVNFARAGDIAPRLKDVLSERGTVSTDDRTNVLIVKDIPDALVRAEGLVRNLDAEIPQVLIEARIVEAQSNYNRALGVQWGGMGQMTQALGNPTGLIFPSNVTGTGAAGGGPTQGTAATPNYAVNLPAAIGQGSGGGIGFTFGSIGGAFNLNLRLSALENTGVVKTISAPKIATLDNKEATIGQGTSIPFSQTSASGTNTTFVEAKLELKVTPHVSADGSILLKIRASNNAANPGLTGSNGQPSISKREAETEVLVKDGDTTVIGGIYTRQTSTRRSQVPWLGKIPVLGFFFRTNAEQDDHTELLIFITPRILNRSATAAASSN